MREALLIIVALGGLEAFLWWRGSLEARKQTLLLERIADNLTIVEVEEESVAAKAEEAVC